MRVFSILLLSCLVTLAGCWGKAGDASSCDEAFEEVMGFASSPDVTEIESSWYFMKDTYARWLCFSCSDATLARIRKSKATAQARFADEAPGRSERNPNAPSWWTGAKVTKTFEEIEVDRSNPSASIETDIIHIWIDSSARRVYAVRHRWH